MLRHTLKLIWNRRRTNALVIVEVGLAFLAAFVVLAMAAHYWASYRRPLGFEYDHLWRVQLLTSRNELQANAGWDIDDARILRQVVLALREVPKVEAAHVIRVTPFLGLASRGPWLFENGKIIGTTQNAMTSGALELLGAELTSGRWFNETDEGQNNGVAIVNQAYVDKAFGPNVDPLNQNINQLALRPTVRNLDGIHPFFLRDVRIVGIVKHLRSDDLADEVPMVVTQYELEHAPENAVEHANALFLKVAPDAGADVEEQIVGTFRNLAPDWRVVVIPWTEVRARLHARVLKPVTMGAILAGFILVMVVLGLIGVIGLDVVRRTQEIGLRRAIGASAMRVRRQVVLEQLVIGAFGILCGLMIALQFPLLELIEEIHWSSALAGGLLATALTLLLIVLSALHPSWVASRREPADALRYE